MQSASVQARGINRTWGAAWLPLVIAPTFMLAAFLPVLFDVIKDIPPAWDCGEGPPLGQDHDYAVASYKSGWEVLHGFTMLLSLVAVLALSSARKRRVGEGGVGVPTGCAVALFGIVALFSLSGSGLAGAGAIAALLPAIMLGFLAAPLGPQVTGLIAAGLIVCAGLRATLATRVPGPLREPSALCWGVFVLTAGHALIVSQQGHGPYLC